MTRNLQTCDCRLVGMLCGAKGRNWTVSREILLREEFFDGLAIGMAIAKANESARVHFARAQIFSATRPCPAAETRKVARPERDGSKEITERLRVT